MLASALSRTDCWVVDCETNGLLDTVSEVHCVVARCPATGEVRQANGTRIDALLEWLSANAGVMVGHNIISFDLPVFVKLHGFTHKAQVLDTMVLTRLGYPHILQLDFVRKPKGMDAKLYGRHSLEAWGHRIGALKGAYGKSGDEDTDAKAWENWSQEMQDYCVQDVLVTEKLLRHMAEVKMSDASIQTEMDLQDIIAAQERHGFAFDARAAMELNGRLLVRRDELLAQLQSDFLPKPAVCLGPYGNQLAKYKRLAAELGDPEDAWQNDLLRPPYMFNGIKFKWTKEQPFNPNSEKQIIERMEALGWVPTDFTEKGQAKMDEDVLLAMAQQIPAAAPLVEFSLVEKRIGALSEGKNAWLKLVGDDGRMHGRHNTMGAISFRFTHSRPNMGQVPSVRKPYGKECRALFHVPAGKLLVGCDVSGLELRILAHYMARLDGGAYAKIVCEGDIHTANQQAAGLTERDQAKTFIYALIYGAGDGKLGQISLPHERDMALLQKTGKGLRKRFLSRTPALAALERGVRAKASSAKTLTGIDGRILRVRSAHSALNLLIQSAGAIATKVATVKFRELMEAAGYRMERDWCLVAHVHDEWQTEVNQEIAPHAAKLAVESIVLAGQQLGLRCPLTGESKIGRNWCDTH